MASRPLLASALLLVASCASTPKIDNDFDPTADFSRYHSYSWAYAAVPQGMNPLQYERVQASIDRSLASRSFTPGSPGEFAIAFTIGARDKVQVNDFGPYAPFYGAYRWGWGGGVHQVDVSQYTEGTLAIDIYDVASKKPVWHGVATQNITPGKVDQAQIDTAVDAVLAKFPPAAGGS